MNVKQQKQKDTLTETHYSGTVENQKDNLESKNEVKEAIQQISQKAKSNRRLFIQNNGRWKAVGRDIQMKENQQSKTVRRLCISKVPFKSKGE